MKIKSNKLIFHGDIVAKPRMTQSDKWKSRNVTSRYWAFKDLLTIQARLQGFELGEGFNVTIHLPMPKSWSNKKREEYHLTPHMQKPDIDNILKSIQDILLKDDSGIWHVNIYKFWTKAEDGYLMIENSK